MIEDALTEDRDDRIAAIDRATAEHTEAAAELAEAEDAYGPDRESRERYRAARDRHKETNEALLTAHRAV